MNTRMMRKRFKTLLQSLYHESMEKHMEVLENYFEEWKGTNMQVDDIMIMGIRI